MFNIIVHNHFSLLRNDNDQPTVLLIIQYSNSSCNEA